MMPVANTMLRPFVIGFVLADGLEVTPEAAAVLAEQEWRMTRTSREEWPDTPIDGFVDDNQESMFLNEVI